MEITAKAVKDGFTKSSNIFCKYCGKEISPDSVFCNKCGNKQ